MKKALISPNEAPIYYVSGWNGDEPIMSPIAGSCRIAEVKDTDFPVAPPLFWADCPDDCVQDLWYFNTESKECFPVPEAPPQ